MTNIEKDKALFVGYFFQMNPKYSLFNTFDKVYELAEKFVATYDPTITDLWEEISFEETIENFIVEHTKDWK
jgi:uncharacterized protein YabN with tetrapyrrole methylase and pyrophosphatase domain